MRFEPIDTLPNKCPNFVEDAYESLVNELKVTAWNWYLPMTASELERFLIYGKSRHKIDDFFEMTNSKYDELRVFDHAICFKGISGAPFVLTMPYGNDVTFYREFDQFTKSYYAEKERVIYACDHLRCKAYMTEWWFSQLHAIQRFDAAIVPERFKVRTNGDFAAIIAMNNWMYDLSEFGGFSPVGADGGER